MDHISYEKDARVIAKSSHYYSPFLCMVVLHISPSASAPPEPDSLANLIVFLTYLGILEFARAGLDMVMLCALLALPSRSLDLNWRVAPDCCCACIFMNCFCERDLSPRGAPIIGFEAVRLFFLKLFLSPTLKWLRLFAPLAAPAPSLESAVAVATAPPAEGVAT